MSAISVPHYCLSISYDVIATKDDRLFKRVCFSYIPKWRRSALVAECRQLFVDSYLNEHDERKKENVARRAVNFYMLKEAVEYGMTNWREWQTRRRPEQPRTPGYASTPYLKPRESHYRGPSILDMVEQQRKGLARA